MSTEKLMTTCQKCGEIIYKEFTDKTRLCENCIQDFKSKHFTCISCGTTVLKTKENKHDSECFKCKSIYMTQNKCVFCGKIDYSYHDVIEGYNCIPCGIKNKIISEKHGLTVSPDYMDKFYKPRSKYHYKGEWFDSSWELAFWVYHKDHSLYIERNTALFEYLQDGKPRHFLPDFLTKDGLVELKGEQLQANHNKQTGTTEKLEFCKKHNIQVIQSDGIKPYITYVKNRYGKTYMVQFKQKAKILFGQAVELRRTHPLPYRTDLLSLRYHHSIWYRTYNGCLSPIDALYNDKLLKRTIQNQIDTTKDISFEETMRHLTNSNFSKRPPLLNVNMLSKFIQTYLSEFGSIFNPCSGYSEILQASCKNGKYYYGFDLNPEVVQESLNLIKHEKLQNCEVYQGNLSEESGVYECMFTSLPDGKKWDWGVPYENKPCDSWIDECLQRYRCKKYLFIVNKTEKYVDNIVDTIVHPGGKKEYLVLIQE